MKWRVRTRLDTGDLLDSTCYSRRDAVTGATRVMQKGTSAMHGAILRYYPAHRVVLVEVEEVND